MKKLFFILLILLWTLLSAQSLVDLEFGDDDTFEIVTWNIEWFPINGQATADSVSQIIQAIDVDVIAIQEISDTTMFKQMINDLPDFEYYFHSNYFGGLAYVYQPETVQILNIYEIYTTQQYWRPFPRSPMVMEMSCLGQNYIIINNHFKAFGDGIMNLDDPWDEETRRFDAANLLYDFIMNEHPDENSIILGDLNDILTDEPPNNVFINFINDPENFLFTDMDIATGSSINWSYPGWPSHIDHILITNELFDEFSDPVSQIETLKIDEYLSGGLNSYYQYISDHRPVALKLFPTTEIKAKTIFPKSIEMTNYPNPFNPSTEIRFQMSEVGEVESAEIDIYNIKGQKIRTLECIDCSDAASSQMMHSITWNGQDDNDQPVSSGVFFYKLKVNGITEAVKKCLLLK